MKFKVISKLSDDHIKCHTPNWLFIRLGMYSICGQKNLRLVETNSPAHFKRADVGCGYKLLADAVEEFAKLGQLPSGVRPLVQFLDEGMALKLRVLVVELVGISSANTDSFTPLS
jgi:hypothetical protein